MTQPQTFTCWDCHEKKRVLHNGGTGYAETPTGEFICYECCAKRDIAAMSAAVPGQRFTHYLTKTEGQHFVGNWCSTFKVPVTVSVSRHNIGGKRYDFRFTVGGKSFAGYQIGEHNQVAHIKALKK